MQRVILMREDLNNPLHPNMFDDLLEQFGLNPMANEIELVVATASDETEDV